MQKVYLLPSERILRNVLDSWAKTGEKRRRGDGEADKALRPARSRNVVRCHQQFSSIFVILVLLMIIIIIIILTVIFIMIMLTICVSCTVYKLCCVALFWVVRVAQLTPRRVKEQWITTLSLRGFPVNILVIHYRYIVQVYHNAMYIKNRQYWSIGFRVSFLCMYDNVLWSDGFECNKVE